MKSNSISLIIILLFLTITNTYSKWEVCKTFPTINHDMRGITSYDSSTYLICLERHNILGYDLDQESVGLIFYLTRDYGKTWDSIFSTIKFNPYFYNKINNLEGMQFISKDTILIMTSLEKNNAMLAKTFDGGKTWDSSYCYLAKRESEHTQNSPVFYFKNSKEGFYTRIKDSLLTTKNGGNTWEVINLPMDSKYPPYHFGNYHVLGNNFLISANVITNNIKWNKLFVTKDWGKTWEVINDDADSIGCQTHHYYFKSENEIWGLGSAKYDGSQTYIRKSTDRGTTWERIDGDTIFNAEGDIIYFFGKDSIIVRSTRIFRSTNNGSSWSLDSVQKWDNAINYSSFQKWDNGMLFYGDGDKFKVSIFNNKPSFIENQRSNISLQIYPNPISSNQILNISFLDNIPFFECKIKIIDITGNIIDEFVPNIFNFGINVRYSPDVPFVIGTYFLVIESGGMVIAKAKFIVK